MRKVVSKCTAWFFLAMLPTVLYGQFNPKPGFVITNGNDTIYGTINYLSDTKNAYECRFMPDGETEYKVYKPGDISAYRFTNNGIFYITKTFTVDGEPKTFFAEYLLQGGVSLFHHKEAGEDYYFFIGQDGKEATVKHLGSLLKYTGRTEGNKIKRETLREVSQIFAESSKAQHDLWEKDITANNLTKITHDFDMEYCTEAGECVTFRYDEKAASSIVAKLRLQAAVGIGINKLISGTYNYKLDMSTVIPQFGAGFDLLFPRFNKHLSLQALGLASKWNMSKDFYEFGLKTHPTTAKMNYWELELQVGAAYSFKPNAKCSPILRAGLDIDKMVSCTIENLQSFNIGRRDPNTHAFGFYLGAGVDIPIHKHALRLAADYRKIRRTFSKSTVNVWTINAGIRL